MFKICVILGFYAAIIALLWNHIAALSLENVWGAIENTPQGEIWAAVGLTVISYFCLAGLDMISAHTVLPKQVKPRMAGLTGAASAGVCNTVGFHAITGAALRHRVYMTRGIGFGTTTRILAVTGCGVVLGYLMAIALALLSAPDGLGRWIPSLTTAQGHTAGLAGGLALLALLGGILFWLSRRPRRITFRDLTLPFPDLKSAAAQIAVGTVWMATAVGALFVLLPGDAPPFNDFILLFLGAVLLGKISVAPGGLGVIEATLIATITTVDKTEIVAALLLYRFIYNLLPLAISCIGLAVFEFIHHGSSGLAILSPRREAQEA